MGAEETLSGQGSPKNKKIKTPERLAESIGITFNDINILKQALTHSSYVNENPALNSMDHNERLEFLGDSVVGLAVCDYLFRKFPTYQEGELTKIKSLVVSKPVLAELGRRLKLGDYLLLGHGEEVSGGRRRDSLLANAFESIVGAIYLDNDLDTVSAFVLSFLGEIIQNTLDSKEHRDYKTNLQEYSQKHFKVTPRYKIVKTEGPDHARVYHVEVRLPNDILGVGQGNSKKEAEQMAARSAFLEVEK